MQATTVAEVESVVSTGRALRTRNMNGTVTGAKAAARKLKEDRQPPFLTLPFRWESFQKLKRPYRKVKFTNEANFKFGVDKLWQHTRPTPYDVRMVTSALKDEEGLSSSVAAEEAVADSPFHAGRGLTVDSIVRVILSQTCQNEKALDAQQALLVAYPYYVNGEKVIGTKPNYHAMRVQGLEKLKRILKPVGLHTKKPKSIKQILELVYATNQKDATPLEPGEVRYVGNEIGAADFVPGSLAVDYIWDIYEQGGKQAVFDYFVSLPLVRVKSACCLMNFNMNLPVFAVDTHVAKMASLLG